MASSALSKREETDRTSGQSPFVARRSASAAATSRPSGVSRYGLRRSSSAGGGGSSTISSSSRKRLMSPYSVPVLELHFAAGALLDVLQDQVAVLGAVSQRQQHVKRGWRERQEGGRVASHHLCRGTICRETT